MSFSALQRAENSSIFSSAFLRRSASNAFQCSSASRKFLNSKDDALRLLEESVSVLFSEPKIPQSVDVFIYSPSVGTFQCSSASRKFLNPQRERPRQRARRRFQCSSASRKFLNPRRAPTQPATTAGQVSVLFSEPKIPQSRLKKSRIKNWRTVSVLFSEPKIPQSPRW